MAYPRQGVAGSAAPPCPVLAAPFMTGATGRLANLDSRLLAAHNRERAALRLPALRWDPDLAAHPPGWDGPRLRAGRPGTCRGCRRRGAAGRESLGRHEGRLRPRGDGRAVDGGEEE